MTAPLAWLYAIPYERFLSPVDAVYANARTLLLVSAWRVLLMARVMQVLWNAKRLPPLFIVLYFGDVAMLIAAFAMPTPIINFMGGFQHAPHDAAISSMSMQVKMLAILGAVLLFPVFCYGMGAFGGRWSGPERTQRVHPGLWAFLVVAIAAWVPLLLWTQPEQQRRYVIDATLRSGDVRAALTEMSQHEQSEYPPLWDPPPRVGYRENTPDIRLIREALESQTLAPRVRSVFLAKSRKSDWALAMMGVLEPRPSESSWARAGHLPDRLSHESRTVLEWHLKHDETFNDADRAIVRKMLGLPEPHASPAP